MYSKDEYGLGPRSAELSGRSERLSNPLEHLIQMTDNLVEIRFSKEHLYTSTVYAWILVHNS